MLRRFGSGDLRQRLATLTLVLLGVICWSKPSFIQAAPSASPWVSGALPSLETFPDQVPLDKPNYNLDCVPEVGPLTTGAQEASIQGCAIYTPYGKFIDTHLQLNGGGLYGQLPLAVQPIPNNTAVLYAHHYTSPTIGEAYLISDFPALLKANNTNNGTLSYDLKDYAPHYLSDKSGKHLNIDYSSISFSKNGDWLVAIANMQMVRVNLRTFDAMLFDEPFYLGDYAHAQTAISNDGRYAVISSSYFQRFRIYDLGSCDIVDEATNQQNCTYRDLSPALPAREPGNLDYLELRFLSDYTLSFYRRTQSTTTTWHHLILTAVGQRKTTFNYLALGDSFASGEGAYDYRTGTDTTENECHISNRSYPYLIRDALKLNTAESVACSGSVLRDITSSSEKYHTPQSKSTVLAAFSAGYLPQIDFVKNYSPDVITVSIGGNDIGFGKKLLRCVEADTCYHNYEDRVEIVREINSKFDLLVATYQKLLSNTSGPGKLYVIGYPKLVQPGGDCGLNVRLNNDELSFFNLATDYLNVVIEQAARKAGARYIDVSETFRGHRLCEAMANNLAVNGITAGTDTIDWWFIHGPIGNESYHPNRLGHELLSHAILEATNNLTLLMPSPDMSAKPPSEDSNLAILEAPHSGRPIYALNYDEDLSNNVIVRDGWWNITVEATKSALRPESQVQVFLHSDPIHLGNFETDRQGSLRLKLFMPPDVPPGFHTLHVYGKNIAGEPVDIYKIVYVAVSATNFTQTLLVGSNQPSTTPMNPPAIKSSKSSHITAGHVPRIGVLSANWLGKSTPHLKKSWLQRIVVGVLVISGLVYSTRWRRCRYKLRL